MIRHGRLSRTRWWVSRSRARCVSPPHSQTPSVERRITADLVCQQCVNRLCLSGLTIPSLYAPSGREPMEPSHHPRLLRPLFLVTVLGAWSLAAVSPQHLWASSVWPDGPNRAQSDNVRLVGHDALQARTAYQPEIKRQIVGGEERWIAYVGHHAGESLNTLTGDVEQNGTSIIDVTDPGNPVYLHHIPPIEGSSGAQMVRICTGDELPNGRAGRAYLLRAGASYHQLFDVTDPAAPELLSRRPHGYPQELVGMRDGHRLSRIGRPWLAHGSDDADL